MGFFYILTMIASPAAVDKSIEEGDLSDQLTVFHRANTIL